jgi:hypothetical protein
VRPYLKKTHHKNRAGGVAQGGSPEFKPQYHNKQTKTDEWYISQRSIHSAIKKNKIMSFAGKWMELRIVMK